MNRQSTDGDECATLYDKWPFFGYTEDYSRQRRDVTVTGGHGSSRKRTCFATYVSRGSGLGYDHARPFRCPTDSGELRLALAEVRTAATAVTPLRCDQGNSATLWNGAIVQPLGTVFLPPIRLTGLILQEICESGAAIDHRIDSIASDLGILRDDHKKLADKVRTAEGTLSELVPSTPGIRTAWQTSSFESSSYMTTQKILKAEHVEITYMWWAFQKAKK
ncbi:hypothetical protein NDU88_004928 [Pleurodeles waltl]|uniref:Uncharacterized protein n=1 Tax=Pleurodeles waltl TaxID=8319 RepID=A0AAV7MZT3_PLEWA|nr:hypothetical protein NDU88_004928 [Pleurodeles waltl]